jgi:hypothetical protein
MTFTKKSSFQNAANALFLNIFEIGRFHKTFVTNFLTNIYENQRRNGTFASHSTVLGDPSVDVLRPPKGCQTRQQNSFLKRVYDYVNVTQTTFRAGTE